MPPSQLLKDMDERRCLMASNIVAAQDEIMRQQEAVQKLTSENERLKKEIAVASGEQYDYVKADKYAALKTEVDSLEQRYQFEKMHLNELTKQYQLARIDLMQGSKLKGGVNAEQENVRAVQRQLEILENRLDQALARFNDAVSYNKELRDHIDIIRGERRVFQRVHKKMEDDLRSKKKIMSERIEQSNHDLDERDGYLQQVEQLRTALSEQKEEYDTAVRNLDVCMIDINRMRDELHRRQIEFEARSYMPNPTVDHSGVGKNLPVANTHAPTPFTEDGEDASDGMSSAEVGSEIMDIPAQLFMFAPDGDLQKLAQTYQVVGESNFSLYKRINELTTSREEMERDIHTLKKVIAEEHEHDVQQRRLIKEYEDRLAETELMLDRLNRSAEVHKEVLARIRETTEGVFKRIGCSAEEARRLVGSDHCTESTQLKFLGLIEERATRILCTYQLYKRTEAMLQEQKAAEEGADGSKRTLPIGAGDDQTYLPGKEKETDGDRGGNAAAAGGAENTRGIVSAVKEEGGEGSSGSKVDVRLLQALVEGTADFSPVLNLPVRKDGTAAKFVRCSVLPSAQLYGDESVEGKDDHDGDPVVSHEELRQQMQQRLLSKRLREEKGQRRKRDLKDQFADAPPILRRK